ncbi:coiled-coil domain-containing protein 43-like isoform X2 [Limulus polyphemus]|uniref:Coiled-coil domain-containing protein 43 n=1 Tax=Limulus polyphemus TaxID=6850 RepID=A0ABM1TFP5_LIMPO|nr:coiled-coil domain-containing protein 43-like isoform X2 [Limulus polyphemus]
MASANEDTVSDSFEQWLNLQLSKLNTDQEVFGSYIKGILEGEETEDEKRDALEGILTEVTENKISELCTEIMNKWTCMHQVSGNNAKQEKREDVDTRLAKIMEKQAQSVSSGRNLSVDEKKVREAILAHYSQVSDGEGYPFNRRITFFFLCEKTEVAQKILEDVKEGLLQLEPFLQLCVIHFWLKM